ncbi:linear amide C-N hydrolase, partial [Fournierella sp.]|uniref:linear amide C-N hydrolase n=1 Tax=Allofournierella sp. TaxID=1940256 RepID=UPI0025BBCA69
AEGSRLYEDPVGVLTNNPPFPVQLANLTGYQTLSAAPPENRFAPGVPLPPYGQGMGAIGLPGDCSPMSRFVRAAFLKCNSIHTAGDDAVNQFFRILDAVAMVRGSVMTPEGKPDMTLYSCCADPARGVYYFKTYDNSHIHAVSLLRAPLEANTLCCWPLPGGHGFEALN